MRWMLMLLAAMCLTAMAGHAGAQKFDPDNCFVAATLEGFFPGEARGGQPKRINCYLVRRDGKWVAGLGTATISGRAVYNTALMPIDPSGLKITGDTLTGVATITIVADPWVPKDQKIRTVNVAIEGTLAIKPDGSGTVAGKWSAKFEGDPAEMKAAGMHSGEQSGTLSGGTGGTGPNDIADASYDLALYRLVPGTTKDQFHTRRAISLGVKDGKIVSGRVGVMDLRHNMFDWEIMDEPTESTVASDEFSTRLVFKSDSLDGEEVEFDIRITGKRVAGWLVGQWQGSYKTPEGKTMPIEGYFRGDVRKGAFVPAKRAVDNRPWFKPVAGHKPVAAGEHPRLFFRKDDIPELRRRAATPEGQAIVKRLREQLNGTDGKSMPTSFNPATRAYAGGFKATTGTFTISHAAGYGFLYTLTGEQIYADLARQCIEKSWAGQRSGDDRYAWVAPGGELRAGPSIGWHAVAYDLCYEAWPEDFRKKVALSIQDYADTRGGEWNNPENITIRGMVLTPKQGPGSNHFGAVVGGSGLAVLAIHGDPGTDTELTTKYLASIEKGVVRHFLGGWGDGGYYKEGWGASRVGTQGGFLSLLQALRVSQGRDYVNVDRRNATYVTMVPRVLLVLGPPATFPYRSNMGPTYGNPEIGAADQRTGMSHGGYFSEGFGAVADEHKPALLWMWNKVFNADGKSVFDTDSPYPHRSMLALVNWPTFTGLAEKNPAEVMPLATRDTLYDFFAFRNTFGTPGDVVTTALINQPAGTKPRELMVWGMGLRLSLGETSRNVAVKHYAAAKDGSGEVAAGDWSMVVDHSLASGADVLVVTSGGMAPKFDAGKSASAARAKLTTVQIGKKAVHVLTMSLAAKHPEVQVQGETIVVGGQSIKWVDGSLRLGKITP